MNSLWLDQRDVRIYSKVDLRRYPYHIYIYIYGPISKHTPLCSTATPYSKHSSLRRWQRVALCFWFWEMTFLNLFDMYLVALDDTKAHMPSYESLIYWHCLLIFMFLFHNYTYVGNVTSLFPAPLSRVALLLPSPTDWNKWDWAILTHWNGRYGH